MKPMLVTTPAAQPGAAPSEPAAVVASPKPRAWDGTALRLHRLADRFDLLPPAFGEQAEIDEADARAVTSEWVRCLRLWADYSPEQVFALKVGAALLIAALVGLWIFVGFVD